MTVNAAALAERAEIDDEAAPVPVAELLDEAAALVEERNAAREHLEDRGVLAVLDPRLRTMAYGRRFLDSLPPAPITYDQARPRRCALDVLICFSVL